MKKTLLLILLLLPGCAAYSQTYYEAWQGKPIIFQGDGGTMNKVDGVEIWNLGAPSRKIQITGLIRQKSYKDVLGIVDRYSQEQLVKTVAEHNGNGVVLLDARNVFKGYSHNVSGDVSGHVDMMGNYQGTYQGTGSSRAVYQNQKVLAVFRYIQ